jgi:hypothetical protein
MVVMVIIIIKKLVSAVLTYTAVMATSFRNVMKFSTVFQHTSQT